MLIDLGNSSEGIVYFAPIPLYYKFIETENIDEFNEKLKTLAKQKFSKEVLDVPDEHYDNKIVKLYEKYDFFEEYSKPSIGKWHGIKTNNFLSLSNEYYEVDFLKKYIIKEYKNLISKIKNQNIEPILTENWIQFYKNGDSKILHNHERYEEHNYKNLWSGAYYIDDGNPKDFVKYSGLFSFKIREKNYYIRPKKGLMIMWESDLLHQVHEFYGDKERIVLNWNILHK
jgi:hypothetical protein